MVRADARPEKQSFVLVLFRYGDGLASDERYTDWDQDFSGHSSEPRMSVQIPQNTGVFDKKELRIGLPIDPFTERISNSKPHSPLFVRVTEVTLGVAVGDQNSVKTLYTGRVTRAVQNFQGKSGWVGIFAKTRKARMDFPLAPPATHHCIWQVYDTSPGACASVRASHTVIAEIDSVDGFEVTAANINIAAQATDDRYWKQGYLEKDGLRISVRDYDGSVDVTKFQMASPIPLDWIGGTSDITFVAGCDKSIEVCRARHNQEDKFMGFGYGLPAYHPDFESPQ